MNLSTISRAIVLIIPILLVLNGCGRVVDPGKRGLRWRPLTEGLMKEPLRDGFYWRAPWNDVFEYDVRYQSFTEKVDVLTADDLSVTVQAAITMRPTAEEIYFLAQEVGHNWYQQLVRPQFLSAVRGVVAQYTMVTLPERSSEIGNKIEAVMVESLKGRHLDVYSVALSEIEFSKMVLHAIEQKQAKEQEKEQKEFELVIAERNAEIARIHAKGEGDSLRIRAEGEGESLRIRATGQSQAQEIITKTLTPDYLKFKLYESPNAKMIIVPDKLDVPIIVNPGADRPR
ncbi:prohibitin family protein [Nitrospira defluvii]|uniref:Prohibitin family protein n=1 Tax=Nitrospira defluvii TaxID=330214 RepID=A0ABM8R9E7_9BACT|nr:prohibitin family protein [Nitrospira defluvii]CAE6740467.1 Prohibitin family protein [Nitrospira defluvii]